MRILTTFKDIIKYRNKGYIWGRCPICNFRILDNLLYRNSLYHSEKCKPSGGLVYQSIGKSIILCA